jgi:hypothetical protein
MFAFKMKGRHELALEEFSKNHVFIRWKILMKCSQAFQWLSKDAWQVVAQKGWNVNMAVIHQCGKIDRILANMPELI